MPRTPVQVFPFVLVIVRREDQFLMVQEAGRSHGLWYLPAGGVDPGESVTQAAIRETREEAGIDVIPRALLWMDDLTHINPGGLWQGRWRFILRADLRDPSQQPGPTDDSLDARWFTLDEIQALPLRAPEALQICQAVAKGAPELPLDYAYRRYE
jgi:phosphatase NudJ